MWTPSTLEDLLYFLCIWRPWGKGRINDTASIWSRRYWTLKKLRAYCRLELKPAYGTPSSVFSPMNNVSAHTWLLSRPVLWCHRSTTMLMFLQHKEEAKCHHHWSLLGSCKVKTLLFQGILLYTKCVWFFPWWTIMTPAECPIIQFSSDTI